MSDFNFTVMLETPNYTVKVDPAEKYGFFEHNTLGDEKAGSLWFDLHESSTPGDNGRVLDLIDYDGVFSLPKQVTLALRNAGFIVDEIFD